MDGDYRLREWIDLAADLLQRPPPEFPRHEVACALMRTFRVRAVSWDWRDESGRTGYETWPYVHPARLPSPYEPPQWIQRHPLVRWFTTTADRTAQSTARVPASISPPPDKGLVEEYLKPLDCEQQLAMPFVFEGLRYEAFVVGRPRDDFDESDLELAHTLQRLIRGLYLHTEPMTRATPDPAYVSSSATHPGLTATECAVLALVAAGHTTYSIALRLEMAPRTASKHLEHIYRKLGVTNRVSAVMAARQAGLDGMTRSTRYDGTDSG